MLTEIFDFVYRLPRLLVIGLFKFYQLAISPFFPPRCRYLPTCSAYSIQALQEYGFVKGIILSTWRFLRCNPFGGSGYDPPRWFGEKIKEITGEDPPACGCETPESCMHKSENQKSKRVDDDDS